MKSLVLALSAVLISSTSTIAWAGERGRHWHNHDNHNHHNNHHNYSHHQEHNHGYGHHHGAYLVGGMLLGAAVSELSRPRETYVKETVYVTDQPRPIREYRLEGDGRCYEVENRGDRRVLLEVPRSACY